MFSRTSEELATSCLESLRNSEEESFKVFCLNHATSLSHVRFDKVHNLGTDHVQ